MSGSPSGSSSTKQRARTRSDDVIRVRGALADTKHMIDAFTGSFSDLVEANRRCQQTVETLVARSEEQGRRVDEGLDKLAKQMGQQSHLPDDLARLVALATQQLEGQAAFSADLQVIKDLLLTTNARLVKVEDSSASNQRILADLVAGQSRMLQTHVDLLQRLNQLPAPMPPPAVPHKFFFQLQTMMEGGQVKNYRAVPVEEQGFEECEDSFEEDIGPEDRTIGRGRSRTVSDRSEQRSVQTPQGSSARDDSRDEMEMDGVEQMVSSSPLGHPQNQQRSVDELSSPSAQGARHLPHGPAATNWRSPTPDDPARSSSVTGDIHTSPQDRQPFASTSRLLSPAQIASPAQDDRAERSSSVLAPESSFPPGPSSRTTQQPTAPSFAVEGAARLSPEARTSSPARTEGVRQLKRRQRKENRDDEDDLFDLAATTPMRSPIKPATAVADHRSPTRHAEVSDTSLDEAVPSPGDGQRSVAPSARLDGDVAVPPGSPGPTVQSDSAIVQADPSAVFVSAPALQSPIALHATGSAVAGRESSSPLTPVADTSPGQSTPRPVPIASSSKTPVVQDVDSLLEDYSDTSEEGSPPQLAPASGEPVKQPLRPPLEPSTPISKANAPLPHPAPPNFAQPVTQSRPLATARSTSDQGPSRKGPNPFARRSSPQHPEGSPQQPVLAGQSPQPSPHQRQSPPPQIRHHVPASPAPAQLSQSVHAGSNAVANSAPSVQRTGSSRLGWSDSRSGRKLLSNSEADREVSSDPPEEVEDGSVEVVADGGEGDPADAAAVADELGSDADAEGETDSDYEEEMRAAKRRRSSTVEDEQGTPGPQVEAAQALAPVVEDEDADDDPVVTDPRRALSRPWTPSRSRTLTPQQAGPSRPSRRTAKKSLSAPDPPRAPPSSATPKKKVFSLPTLSQRLTPKSSSTTPVPTEKGTSVPASTRTPLGTPLRANQPTTTTSTPARAETKTPSAATPIKTGTRTPSFATPVGAITKTPTGTPVHPPKGKKRKREIPVSADDDDLQSSQSQETPVEDATETQEDVDGAVQAAMAVSVAEPGGTSQKTRAGGRRLRLSDEVDEDGGEGESQEMEAGTQRAEEAFDGAMREDERAGMGGSWES